MQKILIITYYWPPAGGPGVQRWLKFVKYLPEFGIEPVVYIPENPTYPIIDDSFTLDIPKGIKIYKHPIREPYHIARIFSGKKAKRISSGIIKAKNQSVLEKIMLWVRGNFFIPDARINWVKPSVKFLTNIIEIENIDTIITTGPPHSVHLIGHGLKELLGIKWIADFRDPWTSIGYHKKLKLTKNSQRKHRELEHRV
ncbi:MAG: glycosyl transferase family 1, partial [Maribacter sp.]